MKHIVFLSKNMIRLIILGFVMTNYFYSSYTLVNGASDSTFIEAVDYSSAYGIESFNENNIECEGRKCWIRFDNISFSSGNYKILMLSALIKSPSTINVYIDNPNGSCIGELSVDNGFENLSEYYIDIKPVEGSHDLYITISSKSENPAIIDGIVLSTYSGNETKQEKEKRMDWWRKARYGQFIHWGPYSNFDFPKEFHGYGEWIMENWRLDRDQYKEAAVQSFNPTQFDAKKIVSDAQNTGAKYIVITSKHHDGFSMYDTDVEGFAPYDLIDYGSYSGNDPLMEMSKACKEAGISFGCYYSIMDWHHAEQDEYGTVIHDKNKYICEMKKQLIELIENYDVDLLWFDGEWPAWWTEDDGANLYRYIRTVKPSLIINNRIGKRLSTDGDFYTPEQDISKENPEEDWESCFTMNDTWGYVAGDTNWKSAKWIIETLVDSSSKGGNLLLNVSPDGNGVVPDDCITILKESGSWLSKYGDGIYGTEASPFGKAFDFGAVTLKDECLYIHVLSAPADDIITIPRLWNKIESVSTFDGEKVDYYLEKDSFNMDISRIEKNSLDTVVVIKTKGTPITEDAMIKDITICCTMVLLIVLILFSYKQRKRIFMLTKNLLQIIKKNVAIIFLRNYKHTIILLSAFCILFLFGLTVIFIHEDYGNKLLNKLRLTKTEMPSTTNITAEPEIDYTLESWENCLSQLNYDADIAFLGDSITYGSDFQDYFGADIRICNLGLPGDSIEGILGRISMVPSVNPEKVFVMAGINGLSDENIEEQVRLYAQLIDSIEDDVPEIYIQSVLPIAQSREAQYCKNETIRTFNTFIKKLAQVHDCTYVDLYALFSDNDGYIESIYTTDGIHLTDVAYKKWGNRLEEFVD